MPAKTNDPQYLVSVWLARAERLQVLVVYPDRKMAPDKPTMPASEAAEYVRVVLDKFAETQPA